MDITIRCPQCGLKYKVRENLLGRNVKCHHGHVFVAHPGARLRPVNRRSDVQASSRVAPRTFTVEPATEPGRADEPPAPGSVTAPFVRSSGKKSVKPKTPRVKPNRPSVSARSPDASQRVSSTLALLNQPIPAQANGDHHPSIPLTPPAPRPAGRTPETQDAPPAAVAGTQQPDQPAEAPTVDPAPDNDMASWSTLKDLLRRADPTPTRKS